MISMPLVIRKEQKNNNINNINNTDNIASNDVLQELQELRKTVSYDRVTNLYNMRKFTEKGLKMVNREDTVTGVIVFGANNMDRISAMYGLDMCDNVRQHIGESLRSVATESCVYGRVHEDLFAIMTSIEEDDELVSIIEQLTQSIVEYSNNVKLEITFGVYILVNDGDTIELAISKAELAKRTVKSNHIGENYAFFTNEIEKRMEEDKKMGEEMEYALEHRQFVMYMQPIINIRTHEIIGAEALVRWKHPTMGVLSPFKFLPLFEANNFIIKMDHYIWKEACKTIRHWMDNKIEPIPININISAIHFEHPKFVETLCKYAEMYKVSTEYICLEMPEKIFSEPSEKIGKVLNELKEKGFTICIDNFGSYHSPISFFMNSPVSVIKIDRNFLRNNMQTENGVTFLRYLYAMATEFDMQVIAEGVEDMEQVIDLTNMGCEYAQGFFFAKPMDLREFDGFRENNMKTEYIPKLIYPTFEFEDDRMLP